MGKRKFSRKSLSPIPSVQEGPIVAKVQEVKTPLTKTEREGLSVAKLEKTTDKNRQVLGLQIPKKPDKCKRMKTRNKKTQSESIRAKTSEFVLLANSVDLSTEKES